MRSDEPFRVIARTRVIEFASGDIARLSAKRSLRLAVEDRQPAGRAQRPCRRAQVLVELRVHGLERFERHNASLPCHAHELDEPPGWGLPGHRCRVPDRPARRGEPEASRARFRDPFGRPEELQWATPCGGRSSPIDGRRDAEPGRVASGSVPEEQAHQHKKEQHETSTKRLCHEKKLQRRLRPEGSTTSGAIRSKPRLAEVPLVCTQVEEKRPEKERAGELLLRKPMGTRPRPPPC